jgi:hypothetical protein
MVTYHGRAIMTVDESCGIVYSFPGNGSILNKASPSSCGLTFRLDSISASKVQQDMSTLTDGV